MAALAAAAFQNDLAREELRLNGSNPTQELLRILLIFLREMLPLPAEVCCRCGLVFLHLAELYKARDAALYRKATLATVT